MYKIDLLTVFRAAAAFLTLMTVGFAQGQALETIEKRRIENAIELSIVFASPVQYLRHTPPNSGKLVRIYVQLSGIGLDPAHLIPSTRRLPRVNNEPEIIVRFPVDNSLLILFDQPVSFTVQPGTDGRSIRVRLDLAPLK